MTDQVNSSGTCSDRTDRRKRAKYRTEFETQLLENMDSENDFVHTSREGAEETDEETEINAEEVEM